MPDHFVTRAGYLRVRALKRRQEGVSQPRLMNPLELAAVPHLRLDSVHRRQQRRFVLGNRLSVARRGDAGLVDDLQGRIHLHVIGDFEESPA